MVADETGKPGENPVHFYFSVSYHLLHQLSLQRKLSTTKFFRQYKFRIFKRNF